MNMNIGEIFQKFGPLKYDDFINLFIEPPTLNEKYLLTLTLQKIIGSKKISECLFEQYPDFNYVFNEDNLTVLMDSEFLMKNVSKKEILNLFVNLNNDLLNKVLDLNMFEKIYIIHDAEEYDTDCLNIVSGTELSFSLLEKTDLKVPIFLKNLVNSNGKVNIKYLDHLDKCMALFSNLNTESNNFIFDCLEFIIKLDKPSLKKIMAKFNLSKYMEQFNHEDVTLEQEQIENLLFINNNIINSTVLQIILNSYYIHKEEGENDVWIKKIFKDSEICYSNYDLFSWIIKNSSYCYEKHYKHIEEIHHYTFHDIRTCHEFYAKDYFAEKLADLKHVIYALDDIFDDMEDDDYDDPWEINKALLDMIDYMLRNRSGQAFKDLLNNPMGVLFHLYKVKPRISQEFNDVELILKFNTHEIKTTINELLNVKNWDDVQDFCDKINKK